MQPCCISALQPPLPLHSQPGCPERGSPQDLPAEQVGHRGGAVEPPRQLLLLLRGFGKLTRLKAAARALPQAFVGETVPGGLCGAGLCGAGTGVPLQVP